MSSSMARPISQGPPACASAPSPTSMRANPSPRRYDPSSERRRRTVAPLFSGFSRGARAMDSMPLIVTLSARWREAQDAVVAGDRGAASVAVVRQDPQGAVGCLDNVAEPSGFALQERLPFGDVVSFVQPEPPEALAPQARHEEAALPLRDRAALEDLRPAWRGFDRGERGDRVDIIWLAARSFHVGPAVVAARLDLVYLVVGVLA